MFPNLFAYDVYVMRPAFDLPRRVGDTNLEINPAAIGGNRPLYIVFIIERVALVVAVTVCPTMDESSLNPRVVVVYTGQYLKPFFAGTEVTGDTEAQTQCPIDTSRYLIGLHIDNASSLPFSYLRFRKT